MTKSPSPNEQFGPEVLVRGRRIASPTNKARWKKHPKLLPSAFLVLHSALQLRISSRNFSLSPARRTWPAPPTFFILHSLFFTLYSLLFILHSLFFTLHSLLFILHSGLDEKMMQGVRISIAEQGVENSEVAAGVRRKVWSFKQRTLLPSAHKKTAM